MSECGVCGKSFDTSHAARVHETQFHDGVAWQDEETLRELYVNQNMGSREVAEKLGCHKSTILKWLDKHGIPKNPSTHDLPPTFALNENGSEWMKHQVDGDQLTFLVHRLVAVSEYGFDQVSGSVVHHKNRVPWDNRPENLEVVESQTEHMKRHRGDHNSKLSKSEVREIRELEGSEMTGYAVASEYGVENTTVYNIWNGEAWEWLD